MARIETWFDQDLKKAVKVRYIDGNVFSQDNNGNVVGVNVYDNGEPATLDGSVSANIVRADGVTVAAVGTLSGNQASVVLPQSAYAVPGVISIIIKNTSDSDVTTLCAVVSNVYQSTTDSIVDPGTIIPSIETLIAEIEAAVASIPADYSSLWESLAPTFSTSKAYNIGEYVTYNGNVYRFVKSHAVGTWDSTEVISTNLGNGITDNKNGLDGFALEEDISFLCDMTGIYIKRTDGTEGSSAALKCSDFIKIPDGVKSVKVGVSYYLGNTKYYLTCGAAFYTEGKAFISAVYSTTDDYAEGTVPQNAVYVRFSQVNERYSTANNIVGGVWMNIPFSSKLGLVGTYDFTFGETQQIITSDIVMKPQTKYLLRVNRQRDGYIRFFPVSDSSGFVQLPPFLNNIVVNNNVNSNQYLSAFNYSGTAEKFSVSVYEIGSVASKIDNVPVKYVVSKVAVSADYTSLTQCLVDLKDDSSPKIIEVWEGVYDIFEEYQTAVWVDEQGVSHTGIPVYTGNKPDMEFVPFCVFIPENTHVIGKGTVRIEWMPDPAVDNITWMQCYAVSPVNVMGSMTLENVEIHCKNGRYCIHNDTIGLPPFAGAEQKFINVRCYKYIGDYDSTTTPGETHIYGTSHCIGYGLTRSQIMIFDNCLIKNEWNDDEKPGFGRGFYGHTNVKWAGVDIVPLWSGEIILKDCIIDTASENSVYLVNSGAQKRIRTKLIDCYINNKIKAVGAGLPNSYDITFLNCGAVSVHVDDASNPYPPKGYRTTITTV